MKIRKIRQVKIYCPKCQWEPRPSSYWVCLEVRCNASWNTFNTGGVCPDCGKAWERTQCPSCSAWSPHSAWYHEFIIEERTEEVLAEITAPVQPQRP